MGTGAKLKGERLADHALPVFHVGESSGTVIARTFGALEGSAITSIGEVVSDIVGTSTGYLARTKEAVRRQGARGWFLAFVIVSVWWVLESSSDTFIFGEGDLVSTLMPLEPAETWDRVSLALALFGFVSYARWSGERWKAADALREGRRRFENSFLSASVGMALVGLDGRWLEVNPALCRIVGYPEEELLAKTFQDVTHPDDLKADLEQVDRLVAGEIRAYQMEKRYVRKDGRSVWILLNGSLVRDEPGGEPFYFIAQIQDITERKNAEEELRSHALELEREVENHASILAERDERLRALVSRLLVAHEEERCDLLPQSDRFGDGARGGPAAACELTERELEVVRFLPAGSTNRQIAQALHLSPATVKGHVERIIRKLKVRDRTQAAVKATALGLIDGSEAQKRAG